MATWGMGAFLCGAVHAATRLFDKLICRFGMAGRVSRHNRAMDFKQIEYFVQVAELGSFTRAASVLRVAQPALSRQVRALEVDLRQTLFDRNGRGVTLTEAGKRLLAHGRGILQQVQRARQDLEDQRGAASGAVGGAAVVATAKSTESKVVPAASLGDKEQIVGNETTKPQIKPEPKPEPKPEKKPEAKHDDGARAKALLEGKSIAKESPKDSKRKSAEGDLRLVIEVGF